MKKTITAQEQWMNAMNDLRNRGYDCDKVCEDLGAIGDNEFYHFYGKGKDLFFYKEGNAYGMYDCSGLDAATLLANNWAELDAKDDWYDKAMLAEFLLITAAGTDAVSPIPMEQLLWMHIFDATVKETAFIDEEVEVSTEEIEAIRQEIVERCKGHSIEEVRDMFNAFNIGEREDGSFDFLYDGLVFAIGCLQDKWYLSCIVRDRYNNSSYAFETTELPIPPKEIKVETSDIVDEKPEPDLSKYKSFTTISYDYMVERMRESCINLISDLYSMIGEKFVMLDLTEWRKNNERCYFSEYDEGYECALTKNDNDDVVVAGRYINDLHPDDWFINKNWSFVSLEEMLYIINQLTSK